MKPDVKLKLSMDYLLHREESGEKVSYYLFDVKAGGVFSLNETSYDFLSRCDGTRATVEILGAMSGLYSMPVDALMQDFGELVAQWVELGIVIAA